MLLFFLAASICIFLRLGTEISTQYPKTNVNYDLEKTCKSNLALLSTGLMRIKARAQKEQQTSYDIPVIEQGVYYFVGYRKYFQSIYLQFILKSYSQPFLWTPATITLSSKKMTKEFTSSSKSNTKLSECSLITTNDIHYGRKADSNPSIMQLFTKHFIRDFILFIFIPRYGCCRPDILQISLTKYLYLT